jgi:predicted glutamine amidotransferase
MCIIIAKPKGVELPPVSHIESSWLGNPDGFGCLWSNKKIKSYRTMDKRECMDFYKSLLAEGDKWRDKPMIFHFRYATHGSKKLSNCHAYCDTENTIGFQHNGVLRFDVPRGMDITDSEYFFKYLFMPSYLVNGKSIAAISHVVENLRGVSDKFAFINADEVYLYGNFIEDTGCYYSNGGYKTYSYTQKVANRHSNSCDVEISYEQYDENRKKMPVYETKDASYHCATCETFDCMRCPFYD